MVSEIIFLPLQSMHEKAADIIKKYDDKKMIYISLNTCTDKLKKSLESFKTNTKNIKFIGCMRSDNNLKDSLNFHPADLDDLINKTKPLTKNSDYMIIDALSSLLIYNTEEELNKFLIDLIELSSTNKIDLIALSTKDGHGNILKNSSSLFDKVSGS